MRDLSAWANASQTWMYARFYGILYRIDRVLEHLQGVDFRQHHSCAELGTNPDASIWYVTSGDWHLRQVLRHLQVGPQDSLFDFGCGKGGVLRSASRFPFRRLGGIEISSRLTSIARTNMARLGIEATIHHGDAGEFRELDDWNYVYFFNPFKEDTMRKVLGHLAASLARHPREMTIIYKYPVYGELVETWLHAPLMGRYPASFGVWFHVYRTRKDP